MYESYGDVTIQSTGKYVRIENGQPRELRLLDEKSFKKLSHGFGKASISCTGQGCLTCASGEPIKQKWSVNVYDHTMKRAMVWDYGPSVAKQLKAISDSLKEEGKKIMEIDLRVEASGEKMTKEYRVTPRMTAKPVPPDLKLTDFSIPF